MITLASHLPVIEALNTPLIIFHVILIFCTLLLLTFSQFSSGWVYFTSVVTYNTLLPLIITCYNDNNTFLMWKFSFITSLLMVVPDWYLSYYLNVLVFPEDGFYKIGTVSGYMCGLWTIPFFIILYYSSYLQKKKNISGNRSIGVITFLLFGSSELLLQHFGSWYAVNVYMIADTAVYIILPEIMLGYFLSFAFSYIVYRRMIDYVLVAVMVMFCYLISAATSYYIVEELLLSS